MMLYIHVPFCASHCAYCAFYSTLSTEHLELYYTTLIQEIEHSAVLHGDTSRPITSIFFGGGTPSFIPAEYIASILDCIARTFALTPEIEITLEANPESITAQKASLWSHAGINRISIGCQSLLPESLHLLQRIHTVEDIFTAIDIVKAQNIQNISLDMIWGHSRHTTEQWIYELTQLVHLGIQHISCYALTIEENTLLASQYAIHSTLPTEDELCSLYIAGVDFLQQHGFYQYEISNFSLPQYECKHNLGYWNNSIYYGYGPSASSYDGYTRYKHPSSITAWASLVQDACQKKKELPSKEHISREIRSIEVLMLGLRQKKGVHLPTLNMLREVPFEVYYKDKLTQYKNEGLLDHKGEYISLTDTGFLLLDSILENLLA